MFNMKAHQAGGGAYEPPNRDEDGPEQTCSRVMMMTRVGGISSGDRWSHFAVHQLVIPTHNVFKFQLHCLEVGGNVYVIMPSRPQYIL